MKIKAAITHEQGEDFKIEEVELLEPEHDEVLVKIVASGICHTDVVGRDEAVTPYPVVLGHEGSGIVERVGAAVKTVRPGDHVVLSFSSCGHCENCLSGHPAYCLKFNDLNFGGRMDDGTHRIEQEGQRISTFFGQSSFGTYAIANKRSVVKIDREVDLSLMGPLGCGIQTGAGTVLNALRPEFGTYIAVFGAGAVGLSAIMAAKLTGVQMIIAVDIHDNRLELARELGATHTINSKNVEDVVKEIKGITRGGPHYAIDTTGVPPVLLSGLQALRPRGKMAVVGVTPDMTMNVHTALMAEGKTLVGVIEGDSIPQRFIPQLIEYYREGRFPFDKLVKFYEFEDIKKGFEDSKTGEVIKPILRMEHK